MNPPPSQEVGASTIPRTLATVLARLDTLSQDIHFQSEREMALGHFLQPYLEGGQDRFLAPLPAEVELAKLHLYCDYFPTQGQQSLIEQLRDHISEHVPEEERVWLDPLRHSFMDILEITAIGTTGSPHEVRLQSLGDKIEYSVTNERLAKQYQPAQVLITRLIRRREYTVFPDIAIALSHQRGLLLFDSLRDLQQEMEAFSGAFELGEWQEYVKRYGHIIIWTLANLRLKWLVELEEHVRFVDTGGRPFLHCIAIYEHHALTTFQQTLDEDAEWTRLEATSTDPAQSNQNSLKSPPSMRVWIKRIDKPSRNQDGIIGRLTLTNTQLIAEADSVENFNDLKHWLAGAFGFTLHFKGETLDPPAHRLPSFDLLSDDYPQFTETVSQEEEHRILSSLLESAYLDWAEHSCPALQDKTPRHCALTPKGAKEVATLIQDLENHDLARLRTGKSGFDYDTLRSHVGLI